MAKNNNGVMGTLHVQDEFGNRNSIRMSGAELSDRLHRLFQRKMVLSLPTNKQMTRRGIRVWTIEGVLPKSKITWIHVPDY